MATTRQLQHDQSLPLSVKGVACETRLRLGNTIISCVLQGHWDNQQQSSNALQYLLLGISIISYQTPLLVLNYFNFMHQAKKFGAEILFIPYFSPFGPPSHSPCLLVSAVTITFLLELPARSESSSNGPPSGNTNQLSMNSSQNSSLQL